MADTEDRGNTVVVGCCRRVEVTGHTEGQGVTDAVCRGGGGLDGVLEGTTRGDGRTGVSTGTEEKPRGAIGTHSASSS